MWVFLEQIAWTKKLASRKFWALIAGFVASLLIAFNADNETITKVTGVITAFGSIAVYTFAEAYIDAKAVEKDKLTEIKDIEDIFEPGKITDTK